MTPQEFLDQTSADESHVYPDTVKDYQTKIQKGEPLEPLEIHHDADGNVVGGNGRHRATAMLNEKVPSTDVRVIKTVPTPEEERLDMGNMDEPKPEETPAPDYKAVGDKAGVQFRGVQKGVEGAHPGLAMFQDPQSGTSVAVKLDQWSPEKLQEHIDDARARMAPKNLFDKAMGHYGTTDDINKAGYIGPNGRMLDFSQGQAARTLDHGDISSIEGVQSAHNSNPRNDFADKTGAIRFVHDTKNNYLGIQVSVKHPPTPQQLDRFAPLLNGGKKVELELMDGDKFVGSSGINEVTDMDGLNRSVRDAQTDVAKKGAAQGRGFEEADPEEYKKALAKNPQAASLSDMHPDAKAYQMHENGKATPVYYSINPDGEVAGAINNSGGKVKGAANDIFKDASQKGGKYLTAWDVKGTLPDIYRKQGFETITRTPYDAKTYGPPSKELLASWKSSGWKEGTKFPSVVRMEPKASFSEEPGFGHVTKDIYDNLEPDERQYMKDDKTTQHNVMKHYYSIQPSIEETTNAMQAGSALGGWWQRYIDIFHGMMAPDAKEAANAIGPTHAEALKQWHAAVSGNKSVQDANNLAWHSYADWLDAGKPLDRKSIDNIVRSNGAQPEGSLKKGNAAISDTLYRGSKRIKFKGLDTNKLFALVNSPEMKGERPFAGNAFDEKNPNPLVGKSEGARKIPSMGATVAGKGNLNRLVIDAHIRDFYGHKSSGGPAAQYIADSVHLRQAAKALGLQGGEGQEQLWGTVLGLKELLKSGLTNEGAAAKMGPEVINKIGKDYAEVIANDPEITKPGGILDRLKERHNAGKGSAGFSEAYSRAQGPGPTNGSNGPAGSQASVSPSQLEKTAARLREAISPKKIKKLQEDGGGIKGWQHTLFGKDEPEEAGTEKEREPGEEE
jgi:hypothetical protein